MSKRLVVFVFLFKFIVFSAFRTVKLRDTN